MTRDEGGRSHLLSCMLQNYSTKTHEECSCCSRSFLASLFAQLLLNFCRRLKFSKIEARKEDKDDDEPSGRRTGTEVLRQRKIQLHSCIEIVHASETETEMRVKANGLTLPRTKPKCTLFSVVEPE